MNTLSSQVMSFLWQTFSSSQVLILHFFSPFIFDEFSTELFHFLPDILPHFVSNLSIQITIIDAIRCDLVKEVAHLSICIPQTILVILV